MRPFEGWRVQFAARRIGEYKVMIVMMLFFWEPDLNLNWVTFAIGIFSKLNQFCPQGINSM